MRRLILTRYNSAFRRSPKPMNDSLDPLQKKLGVYLQLNFPRQHNTWNCLINPLVSLRNQTLVAILCSILGSKQVEKQINV